MDQQHGEGSTGPQAMRPVAPPERIELLDVLRGAALFGIIAANMRGFNGPLAGYMDHTLMWTDPVSRVAQGLVDFFISGKFITLFSFMFGIGFAVQMERADARGIHASTFYVRRLVVLLLFGLAHSLFLWWGDILAPYAIMGFFLILLRRRSQRTILRWSALIYAYPLIVSSVMLVLQTAGVPIPSPPATTPQELARVIGVYGGGSYAAILTQNVAELAFNAFGLVFFYPRVLGIFLFGLWVWREGILRDLASKTPLLRRCQRLGLVVAVVLNAATVAIMEIVHPNPLAPSGWGLVAGLTSGIGMPAGSLFYVSTLALLWQSPKWRARLRPFGAVGRTALSNYLLQTVLCTTLYYSWGGALYGRVGPLLGLVPTVVIYGGQLLLSGWWVERFAYGPMEWLWRRLTYGRAGLVVRGAAAVSPGA
jgi:uncharacterized protein